MLVVPADVLRSRRPDEHFADEARAARDAGCDVVLLDHDALSRPDGAERAVAGVPRQHTPVSAVYRGWMLRSEQYATLADTLAARGVTLLTDADQYRQAHEFPGWYRAFVTVTPQSTWTIGDDRAEFETACRELGSGAAVLRDYVKSMKHYWHEAAYIPEVADPDAAWKVASRFRSLRDEDFVGGFVLRRFEHLEASEARTWWVDGICRLVSAHPDTPDALPPADLDTVVLAPLVAALELPFVTVDLARRHDGVWRVVELGDGQVSDRPISLAAKDFVSAIAEDRRA